MIWITSQDFFFFPRADSLKQLINIISFGNILEFVYPKLLTEYISIQYMSTAVFVFIFIIYLLKNEKNKKVSSPQNKVSCYQLLSAYHNPICSRGQKYTWTCKDHVHPADLAYFPIEIRPIIHTLFNKTS